MYPRKLLLSVAVAIFLCASPFLASAAEDPKDSKPDPNNRTHWENAGFKSGWTDIKDTGVINFSEKETPAGVSTFRYSRNYGGINLKPLPAIAVPFGLILDDAPIDDAFLVGLGRFQKLRSLCLRYGTITETGIKEIAQVKELKHLEISRLGSRANVKDSDQTKDLNDAIKHLTGLTKLESLNMSETRIQDDGLKNLSKMKSLRQLNLRDTKITDQSLDALKELEALNVLDISGTNITSDGLENLKKSLPKATIRFDKN